jgi:eukaryotic-like serine/threonine-protein kinase
MTPDPQRIQVVFLAAIEITDPAERQRYLDEACGDDSTLKARVVALFRAHDTPDSLLDRPPVKLPDPFWRTPADDDTSDVDSDNIADEIPLGFLAPASRPGSLGRIGHYEVLQVLGRGGFGTVLRAFDDVLQRVVAVKVLASHMAATSPARKRFLREARSSAQVRHENVVQIYEVGETPLPYLVMEFIPGETLQQRIDRSGPLDVAAVLRIGRQIAEGLAAAHATDLIHRDIKPGNILLEGGTQKVKITDFGLARAADDASPTQSGVIAGTPMYMAPEQAKGESLDHRADLFSMGSVIYQMTAGRPPFRSNSTLAVLKRVAEDTPRAIREIIPETPTWLCDIISKLHAKNPDDRFSTAREVADLFADCEAQLKASNRVKLAFTIRPVEAVPVPMSRPTGWKWLVAGLLIAFFSVAVAVAVTEATGLTRLFRREIVVAGPGPSDVTAAADVPAPKEPPKAIANPPVGDPDERAANYVLRIGGGVRVQDKAGDIRVSSDLPENPFRLTRVLLNANPRVTDAGLMNLAGCKNLTHVELACPGVTDDGLAHLSGCENLLRLNLHDNERITDAGLVHLKACRKLTHLLLSNVIQISDAGLVHLKNHPLLENLLLYGTQVTDAGLIHLTGLTQLTTLSLNDTKVTRAGAETLAKSLPKCKIIYSGGAIEPK